jgi:UDP-N-acetylglucosamine acyltransferase
MGNIHPTSIVSPKAKLGSNVIVEPFAIINDDVEIGNDCLIGPHSIIYDGARIGNEVKIYQGASISHQPQDKKYNKEETFCYIGDKTRIHEFATIHRGTTGTGKTTLGKNVLIMAYAHVAHDCIIGDNCILANAVQLGGFAQVDEWAIIGGSVPVHQFVKIGKHVIIGGGTKIGKDIPPFIMAAGEPIRYYGLNLIGLKRRGFTSGQIDKLKAIYKIIYDSHLNFTQAKEKLLKEMLVDPLAIEVVDFMNKSTRGIVGK